MTSEATHNVTSSPAAGFGPLQPDLLDGLTTGPSGQARVRASRSAKPDKAAELLMNGICGPTFTDSYWPEGPLSSWENRLRERLAMVGSTESALIWERKATPAGQSIFRLRPWTRPTSGNGSIGSQWPTPRTTDSHGPELHGRGGQDLRTTMAFSAWVTPSSRDWKDSPGMATEREDGRSRIDQLPRQMAATVLSGQTTNGSSATTAKRGAPNPVFACWLMGFPDEWVSGALRAMQSLPRSRRKSSQRSVKPSMPEWLQ